ncbi:MAG: flagellar motor protein MotD [Halioglobus sp.]|nr:flagellar motor protein MotD [Halioglobus sp.]
MIKRVQFEEQSNHDRWMVSYADFITLLFGFFVVMYSISSVNEDKYRVLSNALVGAFNDQPVDLRVQQVVPLVDTPLYNDILSAADEPEAQQVVIPLRANQGEVVTAAATKSPELEDQFTQDVLDAAEEEVNELSETVVERMQPSLEEDLINLKRNKFWLEVEIKSSLLFESGRSALIPSSVPLLLDLADIFADLPNRIHVEGFTDDRPIRTPLFPSNWELSAARAAAVVRLFERSGIDPSRMASIGYGEYQPLGDNDTEEARAKNRRVVLVVMAAMGGKGEDRIHEFELLKERALASADF